MSTKQALGALISLILIGFFIATFLMSITFVFTISPYWWIAVFGTATGIVLSTIAALVFVGGSKS